MVTRSFHNRVHKKNEMAKVTGVYRVKTTRLRKDGTPIYMSQITGVSKAVAGKPSINLSKIVGAEEAEEIWTGMGEEGAIPVKIAKPSNRKKTCDEIGKDATDRCEVRRAKKPKAVVKKAPVKKAPAKKAPVKKAPAKKAPVKKAPAKKAPVKKAPVKKAPVKRKTAAKK